MKKTEEFNKMPKIKRELKKLTQKEIEIGVLDDAGAFMQMIAAVHEHGTTIKAKKMYLTIPLNDEATKTPARQMPGLHFMKSSKGNAFLVRDKPNKKGSELMFSLRKQVRIPKRSFINSTFEVQNRRWNSEIENQVFKIMCGTQSADGLFHYIGNIIKKDIKNKIRDIKVPHNAPLTTSLKGKDDPLMNTGRLRDVVTARTVNKTI